MSRRRVPKPGMNRLEQVIATVSRFNREEVLAVMRAAAARLNGERLFTAADVERISRATVEEYIRRQQTPGKRTDSGILLP